MTVSPATQTTPATILRVGPVNPTVAQSLEEGYAAAALPEAGSARDEFLAEHGSEITVAVCSGRFGVTSDLLAALPALEAIISFGVGYDSTDVDGARARGIVVSNTPDVLTDCVADTALSLFLDTLRRFPDSERFLREGRWAAGENYPLTRRASARRVGILGLGRIGKAIARRLDGFDAEIHYSGRHEQEGVAYTYHPDVVSLADAVDVLIVAVAGGSATAGLVDASVLDALGPDGYLINIARGSVVDEEALVQALVSERLAGAGLDVFAHEPQVPQELLGLPQVVLLPHVGSGTVETRADMASLVLRNLDAWLERRELVTPV